MAPFIHHHQPRSTRESPLKTDNNETTITANSSNSSRPTICSIPIEAHPLVDCSWFGSEDYENEKTGAHHRTSNASRRHPKQDYAKMHSTASTSPSSESSFSSINDYPPSPFTANMNGHLPHPKLEKVGPYMTIASLQAYTILTVVRCLADPTWIVLQTSDDKSGGQENFTEAGMIGKTERWLLGCAIAFTMLSCLGVTLRIMDKFIWLRRVPVICAYFQSIFSIAAVSSFLHTHKLVPGEQFSHGFLACVITVIFSSIVSIMLTIDWWRGFPSAGLSATLKALILASFLMTFVIIIGAVIYTWLEDWTFDQSINFCIVSFSTIGYGNLSPKTVAGRIIFFFYGVLGISSVGFFIVSLRNAVIEQFQWRLVEKFARPSHLTRVHTRMSAKDMSYPMARLEEEESVRAVVKRKMIMRMVVIWIVLWFGGAGVFCAFEEWSFIESLYFCYVTLATIGFGDYVPEEPGSIEFWNIYVFLGLTIFAYILSLFSDSMTSHIHLVDDEDVEEEEDIFGWEHCEDHNVNFGDGNAPLGVDGLKWTQSRHHLQSFHQQQDSIDGGTTMTLPGQQSNQDQRSRLSTRFWDTVLRRGNRDDTIQQQQEQHENHLMYRHRRRSRSRRVLKVSTKERKQMLQAEYYAAQRAQFNNNNDTSTIHDTANNTTNGDVATMNAPSTIKFVDTYGIPHQRTIADRRSIALPRSRESTVDSLSSMTGAPTSGSDGITFGTTGYRNSLSQRRRDSMIGSNTALQSAIAQGQRNPSVGGSNYEGDRGEQSFSHSPDRSRQTSYSGNTAATLAPQELQMNQKSPLTVQTNILQHQPQVKFESPRASQGSKAAQWDHHQQDSPYTPQKSFERSARPMSPLGSGYSSLSLAQQSQQGTDTQEQQEPKPLKMPWPEETKENEFRSTNPFISAESGSEATATATAADYARYLALEHTRQSHSSDATKVATPIAAEHVDSFNPHNPFSQHMRADECNRNMPFAFGNELDLPKPYRRDGVAPGEVSPEDTSLGMNANTMATGTHPTINRDNADASIAPSLHCASANVGPLGEVRDSRSTMSKKDFWVNEPEGTRTPKAERNGRHLQNNESKGVNSRSLENKSVSPPSATTYSPPPPAPIRALDTLAVPPKARPPESVVSNLDPLLSAPVSTRRQNARSYVQGPLPRYPPPSLLSPPSSGPHQPYSKFPPPVSIPIPEADGDDRRRTTTSSLSETRATPRSSSSYSECSIGPFGETQSRDSIHPNIRSAKEPQ